MSEIVYGIHTIQAILDNDSHRFLKVYILNDNNHYRHQMLRKKIVQAGIMLQLVNRQYLDNKVNGAAHQGIIAYIKAKHKYQENNLLEIITQQTTALLLVLDNITDPHNLGACLRCADAAGVHAVIIPRHRSAQLNSTVQKVASGAAEHIPLIRVTNLVRTLQLLQQHEIWIVGTSEKAKHDIYDSKLTGQIALVMGSEGNGMRQQTSKYCDDIISIPMAGTVTSLNVSVATGVCLFEIIRQRQQNSIR